MIVLDTNVLVRYFVNDIPVQANKVETLLETESVYIPESVYAELDFVLEKIYGFEKDKVLVVLSFLTHKSNVTVPKAIPVALELFSNSSLHIVDCIAAAHSQGRKLATFDKKLLHQSKAIPYWK